MSSERLLAANDNDNSNGAVSNISDIMSIRLRGRLCNFLLILLILGGGLLFIVHMIRLQPAINQYELLKAYNRNHKVVKSNQSGPRTILLWNAFFGDRRWKLPGDTLSPDYFRDQRCPVTNCALTNNHDFLPAIEMFDAIVFHVAEHFPFLQPVPKRRSPEQRYVFALMEPPGETKHILGNEQRFYNLTMTYRLDSDIVWPYMFFEDIETGLIVAPAANPIWRKVESMELTDDKELNAVIAGKTKFAAWFVSHCETLSQREELTKSLQRYVNVDVYGACGPLKCPHNSSRCDRMLDTDYKFYFAFENSLCLDYVTEKFYNALNRQIVPVVFGGADYSKIAPPHSYIDAEKFRNVKELADYLIYLDQHPKEYGRYFWWRKFYRLTSRSPFCDLCMKLNAPAASEKVQFYDDIENWWLGDTCYFKPKILF
ncbi:alpha-(1,3)-fucosyltransferase C [Eupeodes corollae]|uniref:alpha-(1,3)-fucosyltransferase C n=1 Tax=Eupeodes corollae TaxID=290404 RepID=UPI002490EB53|nr:alpha-(1,3)-fucosyltransferase C [Eupeodes corollae]XP_055912683.1 alpha-(1,3)-fucosyltransferase C [Eupeodes corollae]